MRAKTVWGVGLLIAAGAIANACSSSSTNNTTNPTANCAASGGTTTPTEQQKACGDCVMANCSTEYNACFGGSGPCVAWANAGCKGLPDSACQSCAIKMGECQQAKCATQCKAPTPTDSGVPTSETGGGGGCDELAKCCPSLPEGDARTGCESLVASKMDSSCNSALTAYKSGGLCK